MCVLPGQGAKPTIQSRSKTSSLKRNSRADWGLLLLAAGLIGNTQTLQAQRLQISSFVVGPDQTLVYPSDQTDPNHLLYLPDEHTTLIPQPPGSSNFLVFAAAQLAGSFGAVALESTDLKNFNFATSLGYNRQVLASPNVFGKCNSVDNSEFDENYGRRARCCRIRRCRWETSSCSMRRRTTVPVERQTRLFTLR
jgi:hypothetical protein